MRLAIAMCLLMSTAMGQDTGAPVLAESAAPSLVVSFAGQRGSVYHFKVVNKSSHAVTAMALRLVPAGTAKVEGRYACGSACGHSVTITDNARPVIKAGEATRLGFPISSVNGGAVLAEAAIFDDESYEGEERAAAFLVAEQIGRQAEYDRLIAAVNSVMITGADDTRKTMQIRIKLGEVSVSLDPAMIQTFKRWFPALAGCTKQYARFMKAAATREKALVANSMEQFAHGTAPGSPSLSQWWVTMQQQLAGYGCSGCASLAMRPKAPAAAKSVAQTCTEVLAPILLAEFDDEGDVAQLEEDLEMEAELSEEDEAALDAEANIGRPDVRIPSWPPANESVIVPTPEASAKIDLPRNAPSPGKSIPAGPPIGISRCIPPDGKGTVACRIEFGNRPLPDYVVYRAFFRDVSSLGDLALREDVRWDESGNLVENRSLRTEVLNKAEIVILQQTTAETNRQLRVIFEKKESLVRPILFAGYPPGWVLYAPPLQGLHDLDVLEAQTLNTGIQRLKSSLGTASFGRLDGFVHNIYHWTPGKMVLIRPADEDLYGHFLRYLGTLDELAEGNERAKQETAKRKDELRAAGLGAKELTLLGKVARSYRQVYDRLNNFGFPGATAMGTAATGTVYPMEKATAAGPVYPMGTAQPLDPERTRLLAELRRKRLAHAIPVTGAAMPMHGSSAAVAVSPEAAEAARKELERQRDEMDLKLISDIEQLKSGLGKTLFPRFDAYIHRLYANAGFQIAVAVGAEKKEAKTPSDQQKLPKR